MIRVDSGAVEVEVSGDIPSAAPIINGRLYNIGQIGTFVKLPIGNFTIYGIVASVSNTPSSLEDSQAKYDFGSRFLTIQLVGEQIGDDDFEKGVAYHGFVGILGSRSRSGSVGRFYEVCSPDLIFRRHCHGYGGYRAAHWSVTRRSENSPRFSGSRPCYRVLNYCSSGNTDIWPHEIRGSYRW